jgi:hypothetical protein
MIGIGILGAPDDDHSATAFRTASDIRRVGTLPIIITRHGFCPPRTKHPAAALTIKFVSSAAGGGNPVDYLLFFVRLLLC